MNKITIEGIRAWSKGASVDEIDRVISGLRRQRDVNARRPVRDHMGRDWASHNEMADGYNGDRRFVPNPPKPSGW